VLDVGRIAELVRRRFKVEYTLAGLDLLLHRIGWSAQVPARQATERNEAAIAAWREETWPVVEGRRRTWAPGSASKTSPARASWLSIRCCGRIWMRRASRCTR
jgi:Winged helix-turn helix